MESMVICVHYSSVRMYHPDVCMCICVHIYTSVHVYVCPAHIHQTCMLLFQTLLVCERECVHEPERMCFPIIRDLSSKNPHVDEDFSAEHRQEDDDEHDVGLSRTASSVSSATGTPTQSFFQHILKVEILEPRSVDCGLWNKVFLRCL